MTRVNELQVSGCDWTAFEGLHHSVKEREGDTVVRDKQGCADMKLLDRTAERLPHSD